MIMKALVFTGVLATSMVASNSLIDICFKQDGLLGIDINNKTIYNFDFDLDKKIDRIIIGEEYLVIDMNHKEIKENILKLCDDECSNKVVTKDYICIGDIGTDFGNMFVYKYNNIYKDWFSVGNINKSPNNIGHDYKETYYLDLWSIDERIYKIKGKDTLISLDKHIEKFYKNKNFLKIKALLNGLDIKNIDIGIKTLTQYNNIAYYLQKAGANEEAVYLLEKILEKYPNRTVAHYNLADAYWALGEKKKAIEFYKTYIKQMKEKGKSKRIPKVVWNRTSTKL